MRIIPRKERENTDIVSSIPYPILALFATLFTWGVTALGAALVFFFRPIHKNAMDAMLGFAAGVMVAASFWSLLSPAAELAAELGKTPWIPLLLGFFGGGLLLFLGDKGFDRLLQNKDEPYSQSQKRSLLLMLSVTLHNIPEGMAVGVAFGSLAYDLEGATLAAACLLALGIGLQNFPEGTAVSVPLLREGCSKKHAFFMGQLSGMAEPISGVLGAILALHVRLLLPYLLSFAAGAMIYVAVAELIPESQNNAKKSVMALFTIIGFSVMMVLDLALG